MYPQMTQAAGSCRQIGCSSASCGWSLTHRNLQGFAASSAGAGRSSAGTSSKRPKRQIQFAFFQCLDRQARADRCWVMIDADPRSLLTEPVPATGAACTAVPRSRSGQCESCWRLLARIETSRPRIEALFDLLQCRADWSFQLPVREAWVACCRPTRTNNGSSSRSRRRLKCIAHGRLAQSQGARQRARRCARAAGHRVRAAG